MIQKSKINFNDCECGCLPEVAKLIGGRWTFVILFVLRAGAMRFSDLQLAIGKITPRMLSGRLKDLCDMGLIVHDKDDDHTYELSEEAKKLIEILDEFEKWGKEFLGKRKVT